MFNHCHSALLVVVIVATELSSLLPFSQAQGATCGEVLTRREERQEILHSGYNSNGNTKLYRQRCSWILNAPQATDYEITLTSIYDANVTVTVFPEGPEKQRTLEPKKNYLIHGRIIVITFSTNASYAGGYFGLVYTPITSLTPDDLQISTDILWPASSSQLNVVPERHGSDSLSILVLSPFLRESSVQYYSLTVNLDQLNGTSRSCPDRVTIWTFNTATARWHRHARLCGEEQEPRNPMYIHPDVFMIVYEREAMRYPQGISYTFSDKLTGTKQAFSRVKLFD